MTAIRRFILLLAVSVLMVGCTGSRSVDLVTPAENSAGNRTGQLDSQGKITLVVKFHSRANQGTFKATLDGTDITGSFSSTGNQRTALVVASNGSRTVRLEADMSPGQAFDSTGRNYTIQVLNAPPSGGAGSTGTGGSSTGGSSSSGGGGGSSSSSGTSMPSLVLIRSSSHDVQTFDFSDPTNPALIDTEPAFPSSGSAVVDVSFNGVGHVVRASSANLQTFSVDAAGMLGAPVSAMSPASGTGAAVAAAGTTAVRAFDTQVQMFQVDAAGNLTSNGQTTNCMPSATGVGIDLVAGTAVRAHAAGIQVVDISNPGAPSCLTTSTGVPSSTGVDVKIFSGGTRAVRANANGIETYDITVSPPSPLDSDNGQPSSGTGVVAIALNPGGTLAVRATSIGLETWDISNPSGVSRQDEVNGAPSGTGVAVFVAGTTAFRATDTAIEAYDISNPNSIQSIGNIPGTASSPAATGVGLTSR